MRKVIEAFVMTKGYRSKEPKVGEKYKFKDYIYICPIRLLTGMFSDSFLKNHRVLHKNEDWLIFDPWNVVVYKGNGIFEIENETFNMEALNLLATEMDYKYWYDILKPVK